MNASRCMRGGVPHEGRPDGLQASLVVASRHVEVDLAVPPGETVALVGPNGAGKSTILSVLAGLVHPDTGRATLDGRVLYDLPGQWLPPHRRRVVQLAQEPLLFPHLSALDNVAYGPRANGTGRQASRETAAQWLDLVGVAELATRRPRQLSGGQAQRVAIARALAADPGLLLLDEPMAAVDVTVAPMLRDLMRTVLAARTTVMVTHDLVDALVLADRLLVIEDGRVVQQGTPGEVLSSPRSRFAAELAGMAVVPGRMRDGALHTPQRVIHGSRPSDAPDTAIEKNRPPEGAPAVALITPLDVAVHRRPPGGSPRNAWQVRIDGIEPRGSLLRVHADSLAADITPAAAAELGLAPGEEVYFVAKAAAVRLLPVRA